MRRDRRVTALNGRQPHHHRQRRERFGERGVEVDEAWRLATEEAVRKSELPFLCERTVGERLCCRRGSLRKDTVRVAVGVASTSAVDGETVEERNARWQRRRPWLVAGNAQRRSRRRRWINRRANHDRSRVVLPELARQTRVETIDVETRAWIELAVDIVIEHDLAEGAARGWIRAPVLEDVTPEEHIEHFTDLFKVAVLVRHLERDTHHGQIGKVLPFRRHAVGVDRHAL